MKHLLNLLLLITLCFPSTAQHKKSQRMKEIDSFRIAFYTQKMQLSTEEAQEFWPLFNEYSQKSHQIRSANKPNCRSILSSDNNDETKKTDQELLEISAKFIESQMEHARLYADYHEKFKKILSPEKLLRFYCAEQHFSKALLRKVKEGQRNEQGRNKKHDFKDN